MQRLRKNITSYQGDTIQVTEVLAEIEALAHQHGWREDPLRLENGLILPGHLRHTPQATVNVYISAGVHGDEPAGPLAVLKLFRDNEWPEQVSLWVLPCLNPRGFDLNRRENEDGVDLNRDYRDPKSALVRAHQQWLKRQPGFDFALCLHEDWEAHGFYLYELNPDLRPSFAGHIISQVSKVCPIDFSPEIEGRKADAGVICANPDVLKRPDWPEAFYLVHHKTRLTYTLESPSDFPLEHRVAALAAGVRAALGFMSAHR